MMMKKHITRTLIASAVLFSFNSTAATSYFEARNDAMGGTGVASSHYGVAPLTNPALLTKSGVKDDFSLQLPVVGVQLSDPDNLTNNADKISNDWKAFDSAVDNHHDVPLSARRLKERLQDFRHTHAQSQLGIAAVAALPNDYLSSAFMVKTYGTVSVNGKVSDADLDYLENIADSDGQGVDKNRLTSQVFARAALITDVGIALATELETAGQKLSLGFTPKFQRVDLFNYNTLIKNYDSSAFKGDRYHNTQNGINADIGASMDLDNNWTLGLVAQNLIPRSIETKEVHGVTETFRIRPQVTTGVSWHNDMFTTALDVDLTPVSGFTSDSKRQFAAIGAEFNAWRWAQLRAGYRQNLSSNNGSAFTAGVGLSPFDVIHIDVAGLVGSENNYGAVAQLQFTF
ncbi:conjugal transfer protein TraF [Escherichia coli]|nr:conjugal transfer protein TraF [Escherichia coli]